MMPFTSVEFEKETEELKKWDGALAPPCLSRTLPLAHALAFNFRRGFALAAATTVFLTTLFTFLVGRFAPPGDGPPATLTVSRYFVAGVYSVGWPVTVTVTPDEGLLP